MLVGTLTRRAPVCGRISLQTLTLVQDGQWAAAGANVALSVVLCLFAVWVGHLAAAVVN